MAAIGWWEWMGKEEEEGEKEEALFAIENARGACRLAR